MKAQRILVVLFLLAVLLGSMAVVKVMAEETAHVDYITVTDYVPTYSGFGVQVWCDQDHTEESIIINFEYQPLYASYEVYEVPETSDTYYNGWKVGEYVDQMFTCAYSIEQLDDFSYNVIMFVNHNYELVFQTGWSPYDWQTVKDEIGSQADQVMADNTVTHVFLPMITK